MKKKIGVLTYHHVMNDGAILQAYSQAMALNNHFHKYNTYIIDYKIKSMEIRELKRFVIRPVFRFDFSTLKRYIKLKKFINQKLPLSYSGLISDDYNKAIRYLKDQYDVIVVGSDEVWKNICEKRVNKRPFPNIYWLSNELESKKIALAASANRCDYRHIGKKNRKIGKKLLQDFDFIGVRDQHTIDFVRSIGIGKEVYKVPDPTFTYELTEKYDEMIANKLKVKGIDLDKPVLSFRTGTGTSQKEKLCKLASEYFKGKGYQIVSIGGHNKYAEYNLSEMFDPFEWAHVYKFFDFCITDRFHGTIFSLKNGIPFLSIEDDEYYKRIKSKIVDLLEDFEMMNHYLYMDGSDYDLEEILSDIEKDFSVKDVRMKVKMMRGRYYKMLETMGDVL